MLFASVFAADGILRCLHPESKKTLLTLTFGVALLIFVGLTTSEYSPIVARSLRQDYAVREFLSKDDPQPLRHLADMHKQEQKAKRNGEDSIPNDSLFLVVSSLLADIGVILVVEA